MPNTRPIAKLYKNSTLKEFLMSEQTWVTGRWPSVCVCALRQASQKVQQVVKLGVKEDVEKETSRDTRTARDGERKRLPGKQTLCEREEHRRGQGTT